MIKRILHIIIVSSAMTLPFQAQADNAKNVLDVKTGITDSDIIYPESFERDTQKMLEGWYMKNYTATDDRYRRQGDVETSDDVIRRRLAELPTVIEMPFNQIVRSYIDRYTRQGRAQVAALLGLSIYYMPIFEQALEEQQLPLELKYLPVIESGLDPNAVSKHGAAGLWQFMLASGRGFGLEISSLVDERRDPYLSSKTAARFLKDLYSTYGDWSLAIAAYNCGPGTVNKALRRAGGDVKSHDFWSIYNYLPAETRGYVPMFIAANYVMNYHPYHNISPVLATKPLVTDTIMVSSRVHFDQISHVLDIPVDELRVLNPQFRADIIPGTPSKSYTLVLPSQQIHAYIMSEEDILAYEAERYRQRTDAEPGGTPSDADLTAMLPANEAGAAQTDDTPLEQPSAAEPAPVRRGGGGNASGMKTISHKVEPGETLSAIALKYNVSTDEIKQWNGLTRNTVRTGQKLRVTTTAALADASGSPEVAPVSTKTTKPVTAKPSEPTATAKKTGKTQPGADNNGKKEKPGKKGKKTKEPAKPTNHTVKSGENLSTIAKKYGTTADALKKANGLKDDNIHPGDELKLPGKGKGASNKGAKATAKKGSSKSKSKSKKKRK